MVDIPDTLPEISTPSDTTKWRIVAQDDSRLSPEQSILPPEMIAAGKEALVQCGIDVSSQEDAVVIQVFRAMSDASPRFDVSQFWPKSTPKGF